MSTTVGSSISDTSIEIQSNSSEFDSDSFQSGTSEPDSSEMSVPETSSPESSTSDNGSTAHHAPAAPMAFRAWHIDPSAPMDPAPLIQPIELGPGPGTELKHMLAWFDDDEKAAAINAWGVEGSLFHIDTVIDWLVEVAAQHTLPSEQITRPIATAMVQTAIKRFFKKYPDGVPTDEDD